MTQNACANAAVKLFEYDQRTALENGFMLVDTKSEFGRSQGEELGRLLMVQKSEINVLEGDHRFPQDHTRLSLQELRSPNLRRAFRSCELCSRRYGRAVETAPDSLMAPEIHSGPRCARCQSNWSR